MSGVCVHVDTTVVLSVSYSTDTHTKSAYDTIRDAILTCAQKLTSQLNLPYGTNSKKVENRKLKTKKTDMLRSVGQQPGESVESVSLAQKP